MSRILTPSIGSDVFVVSLDSIVVVEILQVLNLGIAQSSSRVDERVL